MAYVCSRSHGQPVGDRRRAISATRSLNVAGIGELLPISDCQLPNGFELEAWFHLRRQFRVGQIGNRNRALGNTSLPAQLKLVTIRPALRVSDADDDCVLVFT